MDEPLEDRLGGPLDPSGVPGSVVAVVAGDVEAGTVLPGTVVIAPWTSTSLGLSVLQVKRGLPS